jgi:hypothetical protein
MNGALLPNSWELSKSCFIMGDHLAFILSFEVPRWKNSCFERYLKQRDGLIPAIPHSLPCSPPLPGKLSRVGPAARRRGERRRYS